MFEIICIKKGYALQITMAYAFFIQYYTILCNYLGSLFLIMNPRYDARTAFIIAVGINGITHADIPVAKSLDVKKQNITTPTT